MSNDNDFAPIQRIAAGLAHDLNNILGGVNSLASASLLESPNENVTEDLRQIIRTTREGLQVAARLAVIGHSAQPKLALIELAPLLQRAASHFGNISISCPTSLQLMADARLLQEALSALLQNAFDASSHGPITVSAQEQNNAVVVTIINECARTLSEAETTMIPYTSTKKEGRGKGLGLVIARAAAVAHKGELSLTQQGNNVTARLSLLKGEPQPAKPAKKSILIADDEKPMRLALERLLMRAGYNVITAVDGQEALDRLKEPNEISLLLLDRWMPQKNGHEVAHELRQQGRSVPIFLLSGEIEPTDSAEKLGVSALIEKPFEPNDLLRLIQSTLSPK